MLDEVSELIAGASFGYLHVPLSSQRFHGDKYISHPVTDIFVVDDLTVTDRHGDGFVYLANQLLIGFIHADDWIIRVVGELVDSKHILHVGDEGGVGVGWDLPVFA